LIKPHRFDLFDLVGFERNAKLVYQGFPKLAGRVVLFNLGFPLKMKVSLFFLQFHD
jgi:hypothetical protein